MHMLSSTLPHGQLECNLVALTGIERSAVRTPKFVEKNGEEVQAGRRSFIQFEVDCNTGSGCSVTREWPPLSTRLLIRRNFEVGGLDGSP